MCFREPLYLGNLIFLAAGLEGLSDTVGMRVRVSARFRKPCEIPYRWPCVSEPSVGVPVGFVRCGAGALWD